MDILVLVILITLIILTISFFSALWFDINLREKNPQYLPFKWGYFFSISGILWIPMKICADLMEGDVNIAFLLYCAFLCINFLLMFFRIRIAWYVGTILTFNPIFWVINYFYIRKRSQELLELEMLSADSAKIKLVVDKYKYIAGLFCGIFIVLLGIRDVLNGRSFSLIDAMLISAGGTILVISFIPIFKSFNEIER